jgi:hypothetical protein
MGNLFEQGSTFIESDLPADAGRGQNGDKSPSSVYKAPAPIKKVSPPQDAVPTSDWQTRTVNASPLPPAHGTLHLQVNRKLK